MKTFFDSSAYAKRFIEEKGSDAVEEICMQTSSLGLSIVSAPEILSALNRRMRDGNLSSTKYHIVKKKLLGELQDATILNITPKIIFESIELLEKNVLKTMDALHVACALEWNADVFVSSDKRQIEAARRNGLFVRFIESD